MKHTHYSRIIHFGFNITRPKKYKWYRTDLVHNCTKMKDHIKAGVDMAFENYRAAKQ